MNISGSSDYLNWISSYNNIKSNQLGLQTQSGYSSHLLVARFENYQYIYGILLYDNDDIAYIIFGPTILSTTSRYYSNILPYTDIVKKYDS